MAFLEVIGSNRRANDTGAWSRAASSRASCNTIRHELTQQDLMAAEEDAGRACWGFNGKGGNGTGVHLFIYLFEMEYCSFLFGVEKQRRTRSDSTRSQQPQ